jgi:hypothetical protein
MKDTVHFPGKKEKIPTKGHQSSPKKFPKPHNHLTRKKKREKPITP